MAFRKLLPMLLLVALGQASMAQDQPSHSWNGTWTVEGTLFTIRVAVSNNVMVVEQVESMGFEWTSKNGVVNGNVVQVEVEYAGVSGIIEAQLIDENTAIAFARTCMPDFMVVCVLARDRQAVFRKVEQAP